MKFNIPSPDGVVELTTQDNVQLKTAVVCLTPAKAAELLKLNTKNRHMHGPNLKLLTTQMKEGRFIGLNGEAICISRSGLVLDGQHRLKAIEQSETSQSVLLVYDLPDAIHNISLRETYDQGDRRTPADVLQQAYELKPEEAKTLSSVVSLIRMLETTGQYSSSTKASNSSAPLVIERHPNLRSTQSALKALGLKASSCKFTDAMLIAFWYAFSQADKASAATYIQHIYQDVPTNVSDVQGCPVRSVLELYKKIESSRESRGQKEQFGTSEKAKLLILGWNAFVLGLKLSEKTLRRQLNATKLYVWPRIELCSYDYKGALIFKHLCPAKGFLGSKDLHFTRLQSRTVGCVSIWSMYHPELGELGQVSCHALPEEQIQKKKAIYEYRWEPERSFVEEAYTDAPIYIYTSQPQSLGTRDALEAWFRQEWA